MLVLTSIVWHGFFRLDTTLGQRKGGILVISEQVNYFLETFYENIASLVFVTDCHR